MPKLYQHQIDSIEQLLAGKHILVAGVGMGKTAIALKWAAKKCDETGKHKILVITTASKSRTGDFEFEDKLWNGESERELVILSWHKLSKWVSERMNELDQYVVIADEIQRSKGYTTGMGKAFLKIAKKNSDWAGFTGTPGDSWDAFITYFVATSQVRNKTAFLAQYANVQTYKGFPEIVGWRNEDRLKAMWARISYAPDASKALSELPEENYRTVSFSKPKGYSTVLKTRQNAEGEFLDTSGALVAELRRTCFTKDKQQWVSDFVQDTDSGAILFYNYVSTGDMLEQICKKALGKSGRIWRIDGKHHEIPTAETIGKKDMVLCQWQSGSEALNVQFLHLWIGVELCYSNSMLHQSMGRIKRIGQKQPMWFYRLVTKDTIEQDIVKCLAEKKEFSERNWCISNKITTKEE